MARVALINRAGVDSNTLSSIVVEADLPAGKVWLIVGDRLLGGAYQGVTVARAFVSPAQNLWGLEQYLDQDWDCGVVIGEKWAVKQREFPAYFAYLLGHELGHAKTILTNPQLAIYEDLVLQYIARAAQHGWRWDEMPHEIRYDQFGLAIAERLYGRSTIEQEFHRIRDEGLTDDELRLDKALTLRPTTDLRGLGGELASFSLPYRDRLLELWKEAADLGHGGAAAQLSDLAALWSAS